MMRILGIDPGTARVGWGVIEMNNNHAKAIAYGCLTTQQDETPENRLLIIYNEIIKLVKKYKPTAVSVEELFFATNAKTAIAVGQARGVILLAIAKSNIRAQSYTPLVVKNTICGSGSADKIQVQKMVTKILRLAKTPEPDDAADALAIALTHAYSAKLKEKIL